jgi:hypothetical protein
MNMPTRRARKLCAAGCAARLPLSSLLPAHAGGSPAGWRVVVPHRVMPLVHEGDGVGVDRLNNIFLWDALEARIKKLSPAGKLLTWWIVPRSVASGSWAPNHLAVDSQGNSSVLADGIRRYSPAGKLLSHWGTSLNAVAVAAGGSRNVFVLTREGRLEQDDPHPSGGNARIDKYSPQGALVATLRTPIIKEKEVEPDGIAVDTHGNVLVTVATDNSCYGACTPMTTVLYRFNSRGAITQTYRPGLKEFGPIAAVDREVVLRLLGIVGQHDKANRRVIGIDRAHPRQGREMGFRHGRGIGSDELLLLRLGFQRDHRPHRVPGGLAQSHRRFTGGHRKRQHQVNNLRRFLQHPKL